MKQVSVFLTCVFCIFILVSCDLNAPLRNKMLDYYNQDNNYVELSGKIQSIVYNEKADELFLEVDLLIDNDDFSCNPETGYNEFVLVDWSSQEYNLSIGDTIVFVSAPMYFYNGHILPIVQIIKDEDVYLPATVGKDRYLNWIKETFK